MKLLAIEKSRVVSLYRMERTVGQVYFPEFAAQVAERYRFNSGPLSVGDIIGDKAEFKHGLFEGNAIDALDIYNDGIIVASQSDSAFIDNFIHDFNSWLEKDRGISFIETHTVSKIYESILLVETGQDIFKSFDAYASILPLIETALHDASNLKVKYENFGLVLSADHTLNPALKPIPFRFERKEGIEFSRRQYYTTAPLKTRQHLEILERLEHLAN